MPGPGGGSDGATRGRLWLQLLPQTFTLALHRGQGCSPGAGGAV